MRYLPLVLVCVACGPDPRLDKVGVWSGTEVITALDGNREMLAELSSKFVVTIDPENEQVLDVAGVCKFKVDVAASGWGVVRPTACPPRLDGACEVVDSVSSGDLVESNGKLSFTTHGTLTFSQGCAADYTQRRYQRNFRGLK